MMNPSQNPAENHVNVAAEKIVITADDWLRGYFGEMPEAAVKGGSRVPLRKWKNVDFLRLRDRALHMLDPRPGKVILDLGCANGPTMIYCGLQGAKVFGVDMDENHVRDANRQMRQFNVDGEARVSDASKLDFPDNYFDGVISSDFVEHITDDVKVAVFREARRVLKPGGILVTKTPNYAYLKASLLYRQLRGLARFENPRKFEIPGTPGTDDPQHIGLATRWTLTKCFTEAGFLNYEFFYAPLRRFGPCPAVEVLSTEIPVVRDVLCEDLFAIAYKPIVMSHFPD